MVVLVPAIPDRSCRVEPAPPAGPGEALIQPSETRGNSRAKPKGALGGSRDQKVYEKPVDFFPLARSITRDQARLCAGLGRYHVDQIRAESMPSGQTSQRWTGGASEVWERTGGGDRRGECKFSL